MTDNLSAEDRIRTMRSVKSKGTTIEWRVRALLVRGGYKGWRANPHDLPGNPDFAFPLEKLAIFVDGCFWHGCPECKKPLPIANREYWEKKIRRNVDRDRAYIDELEDQGWKVLRIWEHQLKRGYGLADLSKSLSLLLG